MNTPAQTEAEKRYPYSENAFEDGSYCQRLFLEGAEWQWEQAQALATALSDLTTWAEGMHEGMTGGIGRRDVTQIARARVALSEWHKGDAPDKTEEDKPNGQ